MAENPIVLKLHYKDGKYMGREVIYPSQLTPEYLDSIRNDVEDSMNLKQHLKVLREKGYNV